jgi:hypothetical protein
MNNFANTVDSSFNLKDGYVKDPVGAALSQRRKKLADTKFGIKDQFPEKPRTIENGDTGISG